MSSKPKFKSQPSPNIQIQVPTESQYPKQLTRLAVDMDKPRIFIRSLPLFYSMRESLMIERLNND